MNQVGMNVAVSPLLLPRRQSLQNGRKCSIPGPLRRRYSENNIPLIKPRTSYHEALVPIHVAYMENVTITINVTPMLSTHKKDVAHYTMTISHLKSNETWEYQKSFEDFRRFQQNLLKTMQHGHFCTADCPWLYTFVKSYFPKKHFFQFTTLRVIKTRQEGLQQFFTRLHAFILQRNNHGCPILTNAVVRQIVAFVYGEHLDSYTINDPETMTKRTSSVSLPSKSMDSIATYVCDEDGESGTGSFCSTSLSSMPSLCQLCDSPLEGEANAFKTKTASDEEPQEKNLQSINNQPSLSRRSSSSLVYRRNTFYVTTLECGHQFHDECIVPTLNQTLRCPTCNHLEVKTK